jgi:hypothetical protein
LPTEGEILGLELRFKMAAKDDEAARRKNSPLLDDLDRIPLFQQLVGRVEKNDVEAGLFFSQLHHGAIEFFGENSGLDAGSDFLDVMLDHPDGREILLDEDGLLGTPAKGFDADRSCSRKAVKDHGPLHLVPEDVEEGRFKLVRHGPNTEARDLFQPLSLVNSANDPDHDSSIIDRHSAEARPHVLKSEGKSIPVVDARRVRFSEFGHDIEDHI